MNQKLQERKKFVTSYDFYKPINDKEKNENKNNDIDLPRIFSGKKELNKSEDNEIQNQNLIQNQNNNNNIEANTNMDDIHDNESIFQPKVYKEFFLIFFLFFFLIFFIFFLG